MGDRKPLIGLNSSKSFTQTENISYRCGNIESLGYSRNRSTQRCSTASFITLPIRLVLRHLGQYTRRIIRVQTFIHALNRARCCTRAEDADLPGSG